MKREIKIDIFVSLLLAALVLAYFAKFTLFGRAFGNYDSLSIYFQSKTLAFGSLGITFWNPYIQAGYPFFAQAFTGYFAPLNILHYFLAYPDAQKWTVIGIIVTGGIGMYRYARYIGLYSVPAFMSAVVFTFGGYTVAFREVTGIALLPWIFLYFQQALTRFNTKAWILSTILISCMLLNGLIQWVMYLFYALLFFGAYLVCGHLRERDKRAARYKVIMTGAILLTGILIGSFRILSTYELTMLSSRSAGIGYEQLARLELRSLIEWIMPTFFGSFLDQTTNWGGTQYALYLYVGILPLVLACIAGIVLAGRMKAGKAGGIQFFFLLLGGVSLVIAYSSGTPLFRIFYSGLPGFSIFRDHARILWFFTFSVALSGGFGLQELIRCSKDDVFWKTHRWIPVGLLTAALASLVVSVSLVVARKQLFDIGEKLIRQRLVAVAGHPFSYEFYLGKMEKIYPVVVGSICWFAFFAALAAAAYGILRTKCRYGAGIACSVVVLNLFWFGAIQDVPSVDRAIFSRKPLYAGFLQKDTSDVFRTFSLGGAVSPNLSMIYRYQDVKGYDPIILDRFARFMGSAYATGSALDHGTLLGFDERERIEDYNPRYLDYLNVKYIISPQPIAQTRYPLERVFQEKVATRLQPFAQKKTGESLFCVNTSLAPDILLYSQTQFIYRNPAYLPRAYLVNDFMEADSGQKALEALREPGFDPLTHVVLEGVDFDRPVSGQGVVTGEFVRMESYAPDRVIMKVSTPQPALLVLHDLYYPGWSASIDGLRAKIYRANYLFRAVRVDSPGTHEITFTFIPRFFVAGVFLSCLGIVLLISGSALVSRLAAYGR